MHVLELGLAPSLVKASRPHGWTRPGRRLTTLFTRLSLMHRKTAASVKPLVLDPNSITTLDF